MGALYESMTGVGIGTLFDEWDHCMTGVGMGTHYDCSGNDY